MAKLGNEARLVIELATTIMSTAVMDKKRQYGEAFPTIEKQPYLRGYCDAVEAFRQCISNIVRDLEES